ncbi:hypothetical protein, partial [Erythrobacter sp.]
VHLLLPTNASEVLAAALLCMIAGVYFGFATLDGRWSAIFLEGGVACLFVGFATWALLTNPWLLPFGYLAHAIWDLLHHSPLFKVTIPTWYIPACVVVDVAVGLGLWAVWSF